MVNGIGLAQCKLHRIVAMVRRFGSSKTDMPAGAPKKKPELVKVPVCLKLPRWLLAWLRSQEKSMPAIIEDAICHRHKVRAPK